jgi:hypothetical protein
MISVIGQCVETGNETGARKLFDVFETLLILVCSIYILEKIYLQALFFRKSRYSVSIFLNSHNFYLRVAEIVNLIMNSVYLGSMRSTGPSSSKYTSSPIKP